MRTWIVIAGGIVAALAAACSDSLGTDRCAASAPVGELTVVIEPPVGLFGAGATVFVGETLELNAAMRPVTGAATDFFGGGGCKFYYGDPVPATIDWRSSNTAVATVDSEGRVVGRTEGSAIITARAVERGIEDWREIGVWAR